MTSDEAMKRAQRIWGHVNGITLLLTGEILVDVGGGSRPMQHRLDANGRVICHVTCRLYEAVVDEMVR